MKHMSNFIINSADKVREKIYLVQSLIAIQDAHKMMKAPKKKEARVTLRPNPLDTNYAQLRI